MKLLTKTPVAVIIMIVSIVLSAVLGCGRSLKKERSNVEDYFYNGEDGDGYSIQNDIETLWPDLLTWFQKQIADRR